MEERIRKLTVKDCEKVEKAEKERLSLKSFKADFKDYEVPENYVKIAKCDMGFASNEMNSRIDIIDGISDRNYVIFIKHQYIYVNKDDIEYDSDRIRYLISEAFYPAKLIK